MRPFSQYLLRSCAFPQYVIFTVPCNTVYINAPEPHLSFIHMIYSYIHRARQNAHTAIQQKGLCRLNGNYNYSIQFKPRMNIQIRESDPILVNKTRLVTKRNYSNNQKTTNKLDKQGTSTLRFSIQQNY